jgi:hypothetical protein
MDEMKRTLKVGLMFQLKLLAGASHCRLYPAAVRCLPPPSRFPRLRLLHNRPAALRHGCCRIGCTGRTGRAAAGRHGRRPRAGRALPAIARSGAPERRRQGRRSGGALAQLRDSFVCRLLSAQTALEYASNEEILDFLRRYEGSAIADRLRNDWLLELGRKRDWFNFDRELPLFVKNDDYQVKCYGCCRAP